MSNTEEKTNKKEDSSPSKKEETLKNQKKKRRPIKKRPPKFTKVSKLKPGSRGINCIVKVVEVGAVGTTTSRNRDNQLKISEVTVGDETGVIVFRAVNDEIDKFQKDACMVIRNGYIDLFRNKMRMKIDKWGEIHTFADEVKLISVEISEKFDVKVDNNISAAEYELVRE